MSNFFQRIGSETGRWSNSIEHHMPNWMPTAWKHYFANRLNPASQVTTPMVQDYYSARQRGEDPTDARQSAGSALGRDAAIMAAIFGGEAAYGAYGAGGAAGAGGGSGAGAGISAANQGIVAGDVAGSGEAGLGSGLGGSSGAGGIGGNFGGGGINYQQLLSKAIGGMGQGQQQGGGGPPSSLSMQPIESSPATVGSLNPTAQQQGINPMLLSLLLSQRGSSNV